MKSLTRGFLALITLWLTNTVVGAQEQQYGTITVPGTSRAADGSVEMLTIPAIPGTVVPAPRDAAGNCDNYMDMRLETAPGQTDTNLHGERNGTAGIGLIFDPTACTYTVGDSTLHSPPQVPAPAPAPEPSPAIPDPNATPSRRKSGKMKIYEPLSEAARGVIVGCPKSLNYGAASNLLKWWKPGYGWRHYVRVKTRQYFSSNDTTGVVGESFNYLGLWGIYSTAFSYDFWRFHHWVGFGLLFNGPSVVEDFARVYFTASPTFFTTYYLDVGVNFRGWGSSADGRSAVCITRGATTRTIRSFCTAYRARYTGSCSI